MNRLFKNSSRQYFISPSFQLGKIEPFLSHTQFCLFFSNIIVYLVFRYEYYCVSRRVSYVSNGRSNEEVVILYIEMVSENDRSQILSVQA